MKKHLLLLHGALGSKEQYNRLIAPLSASYNVHILNFSGHGGRPFDHELSIPAFAQNVLEYLDENGLDTISIFGYSMGGYVGLHLAIHHPKRIEEVVTLGTKLNWNPEIAAKEVKMLNPDKIEEKVPHFAIQLKERHHPQDWKKLMSKTADLLSALGNGNAITDDDFAKITCPITLGRGSEDRMVTIEEQQHVQSCIPNARVIELKDVQHVLERISPSLLIQYIEDHLQ